MDLEKYKKVILDAIQNEIEAKEFYDKIAQQIKDDYLKKLFEDFSKEEAKHERILIGILSQNEIQGSHFNFETDFKVAETIEMPEVNEKMDLKNAIGLAMKNEEIAMKNYTLLADSCDDPELKAVFLDLAAMERGHKNIMEVKFVDVAFPEVW
ncbi:MAG: ferritin family protein [Deltaproteobacteria bacterium]|jgi:rubrerythrin|nr:ferritin family protein [Deltaproteobacteria bacterium]